jgi:acetyl-CoA synthetase
VANGDAGFVWHPDEETLKNANWTGFLKAEGLADYSSLQAKASKDPEWFWNALVWHLDIRFYEPYDRILDLSEGTAFARWFRGGKTNLVLNALDKHVAGHRRSHEAIVWQGEDGDVRRWTYGDLNRETCKLAAGLCRLGMRRGDLIAVYMPMVPETLAAFLAIAKLGCIIMPLFSGFGVDALRTRLAEGNAAAVITVDATLRRGKLIPMKDVLDDAIKGLEHIRHVIVVPRFADEATLKEGRDLWLGDVTAGCPDAFPTTETDAEDQLLLVFTSGTTGRPKGVVLSHGGFQLKVGEDFKYVLDLKPEDRLFWMSDMGWLTVPVSIAGSLLVGATFVMAEGVPDYPAPNRLWRIVDQHKVTFLGISPTLARMLQRHGDRAVAGHDFSSLRVAASTGEPWDRDSWMWIFDKVCQRRAPLQNLCGGTEVAGGIVATCILFPLKPGGFHGGIPGTGADLVTQSGESVGPDEIGELVMREACAGTTRGLWHDQDRYISTYWNAIPGLWVHGDLASRDRDGVWFVHGRSDDTIKIAGKRTGPSEIESLLVSAGAAEAAAVGVPDSSTGSRLVCLVVPKTDGEPTDGLTKRLIDAVVAGYGTSFRPKEIIYVSDLPKTRSQKVMRRLIRSVLANEPPGDASSLVNPEAVDELRKVISRPRAEA